MDLTIESINDFEKFQTETLELFGKMFESRITSFEDQLEKIETV
jgi:hypothetical protein